MKSNLTKTPFMVQIEQADGYWYERRVWQNHIGIQGIKDRFGEFTPLYFFEEADWIASVKVF